MMKSAKNIKNWLLKSSFFWALQWLIQENRKKIYIWKFLTFYSIFIVNEVYKLQNISQRQILF